MVTDCEIDPSRGDGAQQRNGVIDDALVSKRVFELDLDRLVGDPVDVEGVRIADEVTVAIRRHAEATTDHPPKGKI